MNAYIPEGRTVAKIAVPIAPKRWVMRSTGTRDPATVKRMQAMVDELGRFGARAWDLLAHVGRREWSLMELYERYQRHRGDLAAVRAELHDVALADHVDAFLQHVTGQRAADTAHHYAVYVATLETVGLTRASQLTVGALSRWLDTLPAALKPSTRRKYAAGVSAFCAWLVRAGHLSANPMRDVPKPAVGPGRVRFLDEADMVRLVDAMRSPYRELSALIHGTSLDVSAAVALEVGAIDLATWGIPHVRPKTQTPHTLLVAEWARPYARELVRGKLPRATVGAGVSRWALSDEHRRACQALAIANYWLRDARHSWAVRAARAGMTPAQAAEQMGHRDGGVLFLKLYARYVPSLAERQLVEDRITSGALSRARAGHGER